MNSPVVALVAAASSAVVAALHVLLHDAKRLSLIHTEVALRGGISFKRAAQGFRRGHGHHSAQADSLRRHEQVQAQFCEAFDTVNHDGRAVQVPAHV